MRPQQEQHSLMQILKASLLYFALVFRVGFVLATIRTLCVAPGVDMRIAELMETPSPSLMRGRLRRSDFPPVGIPRRRQRLVMAEQLIPAVDQVDVQGRNSN